MHKPFIGLAATALFFIPLVSLAATPVHVGKGCTTAYYIDKDCDGYGVGVKSSGVYPLSSGAAVGTAAWYTTGDMPDADDSDPTVNTTASWQAKWGSDNAGMVNFLQQRKGFTNTSRIFYVSQSGNDATAVMNDPTHPWRHITPIRKILADLQGGAVVVRGGTWTDLHLESCYTDENNVTYCGNISGSASHPLYIMAYPGERVETNKAYGSTTYAPYPNAGYVTLDGINFRADQYGLGDGLSFSATAHMTVINDEFAGWHQTYFGTHTVDPLIEGNVYHDMMYHTIYAGPYFTLMNRVEEYPDGTVCSNCTQTGPAFDFAKDQSNLAAGVEPVINGGRVFTYASYGGTIDGNVMYSNGAGGYEPIHLNTYLTGVTVDGNIVSYSGGAGMALETGVYNTKISNNIFFDNGRDCIELFLYDHGDTTTAATIENNTIINNTCYVGSVNDSIRGTNPDGFITINDNTSTGTHWIKNNTIANNVVVDDNYSTTWGVFPLQFNRNSFPDTQTIKNNLLWNDAPNVTPNPAVDIVATIASNAGGSIAPGNYNFNQFQALSPNFNNNLYADPKLTSASLSYTLTPELFNLRPLTGSPAINAGTAVGAPTTDILGASRDAYPDIGAYEYAGGSTTPMPSVSFTASPTSITAGQSSTLTWSSTNATSCTGVGFSASATSGSVTVTPTVTTTYSVTCTGAGGTATGSATVTVSSTTAAPTASLTASPTSITSGQSATLTWSSTNATSCTGSGFSTNNAVSGSVTVTPAQTTTYSVTCTGAGGTSPAASATVTVGSSTSTLAGYWSFDTSDISGTTANDLSGSGNSGTIIGGAASVPGIIGQALSFNGASQYVDVPHSSSLADLGPMSVSMWVSPQMGNTSGDVLIDKYHGTGVYRWAISYDAKYNGTVTFTYQYGSANLVVTTSNNALPLADKKWHLITVSWDGSQTAANAHIYVDGRETGYQTQTNGSGSHTDDSLDDVRVNQSATAYFDDVRIYNRALSATEVGTLYANGLAGTSGTTSTSAPTATLTASPTSITAGQSATLTWSSTNATSCTGVGFSASGTSGSVTVTPSVTTTYSISCSGSGGTSPAASATVTLSSTVTPSFQIGATVTATAALNVRNSANLHGSLLCTVPAGTTGVVVGGPTSAQGYTWWQIDWNYSAGCDGWSVQDYLLLSSTAATPAFTSGERIKTTDNLNIRSKPGTAKGSKILCVQSAGSLGTIAQGPQTADGYTWWDVTFDTSCSGWAAESWLAPANSTVPLSNSNPPVGLSTTNFNAGASQTAAAGMSAADLSQIEQQLLGVLGQVRGLAGKGN